MNSWPIKLTVGTKFSRVLVGSGDLGLAVFLSLCDSGQLRKLIGEQVTVQTANEQTYCGRITNECDGAVYIDWR